MTENDRRALLLLERYPFLNGLDLATVSAVIVSARQWLKDEPWSEQAQSADYLLAIGQHLLVRFFETLPPDQSLALLEASNRSLSTLLPAIDEARGLHDD